MGQGAMKSIPGIPLAHHCSMGIVISEDMNVHASDSLLSHHSLLTHQAILLVEDQPDLRLLVKRIPEIKGYTWVKATNGREALSVIQQHPSIGLILSDDFMPEMDGLQLLQTLRQNPMNRRIRFILITGNRSDQNRHRALRESAFAILANHSLHAELYLSLEQGIFPQAA